MSVESPPGQKEAALSGENAAQGVSEEINDLSSNYTLSPDGQDVSDLQSMDSLLEKKFGSVADDGSLDYDEESDPEIWNEYFLQAQRRNGAKNYLCYLHLRLDHNESQLEHHIKKFRESAVLTDAEFAEWNKEAIQKKAMFGDLQLKATAEELGYENGEHEYRRIDAVDFPRPAAPLAFYGIAGEVTEILCSRSELKPEAVLAQFLCIFGNMLGRAAYKNQAGRHGTLINVAIIGNTADGAKGESYQAVNDLVFHINPDYHLYKLRGGYQSSEALIADITDEVGHFDKKENWIVDIENVPDKRLVVVEQEFSRILQIGERDGTTMSEILRQCYDLPHKLAALSRASKLVCTNPFVSILGHITPEALRSCMPTVEAFNGFANRLIYIASQRTKIVPQPKAINWHTGEPGGIVSRLQEVLKTFRPCCNDCSQNDDREFGFSQTASLQWNEIYHELSRESKGKSGMPGAIIARAKPTILRLSMIYAALDNQTLIEPVHLSAAKALWDYASNSALWAFGSASGSADSDKILKYLRRCGKQGASRTSIRNEVFSGHKTPASLTEDLSLLQHSGLAVRRKVNGVDLWFAV
jgi:hypothetical protein